MDPLLASFPKWLKWLQPIPEFGRVTRGRAGGRPPRGLEPARCSRAGMAPRNKRRALAVAMAIGCAIAAYRRKKVPIAWRPHDVDPGCNPWRYGETDEAVCVRYGGVAGTG